MLPERTGRHADGITSADRVGVAFSVTSTLTFTLTNASAKPKPVSRSAVPSRFARSGGTAVRWIGI